MSEEKSEKTDWSLANSVLASSQHPVPQPSRQIVPTQANPNVLPVPQVAVQLLPQDVDIVAAIRRGDYGWFAQFKANGLVKKAALAAIRAYYDGELEVLEHAVARDVLLRKTDIDGRTEQQLRIMDRERLKILNEIGIENKADRWGAFEKASERAVDQVKKLQGKDWPEQIVRQNVATVFALLAQIQSDILKDLSLEHIKQ